ncbi:DUF2155 domain-containing protein [Candidatus Tisiphia endosymbiont of Beris chalybata]|uniref:DUF2155 domain-containing protein n=1 Tax=Candidatus Tisiphia endosymbiont of Beris chalybata TaxID=3066262 RepID=UPI00312C79DC
MLQQLIKYFIFINIIFGLCSIPSYGQEDSVFTNLDDLETTDEIINNTEEQNNFIPNNIPLDNPAENLQDRDLQLKHCTSAKIIALNKITATSKELLLKLQESQYFGNIQIKLHKCMKNLDPYNEDVYILFTITEHKIDEDSKVIFQGWLTLASVSISTFEHPIYEIFVKDCL